MFEFVRKHNRLFMIVLLLLVLPAFVLVGVEGYSSFMAEGKTSVASVDGQKITQAEWDAVHREQVDRMRAQMPTADLKQFDTPEVKRESLEGLLRERVMQTTAVKQHLVVSDERLHEFGNICAPLASGPDAPSGDGWRERICAVGRSGFRRGL
jgi:peptidyl-prolyl cis-trans isomerase D